MSMSLAFNNPAILFVGAGAVAYKVCTSAGVGSSLLNMLWNWLRSWYAWMEDLPNKAMDKVMEVGQALLASAKHLLDGLGLGNMLGGVMLQLETYWSDLRVWVRRAGLFGKLVLALLAARFLLGIRMPSYVIPGVI